MTKKYDFSAKDIYKIQVNENRCKTESESSLRNVTKCRAFLRLAEAKKTICSNVAQIVNLLTDIVSEHMNLNFRCFWSGSFAENTKCFAPDEFDVILDCLTQP